jgi:small subunit ribosomal protein S8
VYLRVGPAGEHLINEIKRVSKPGRRVYCGVEDLPRPRNGMGVAIISTSRGILSDRQCRADKIGGEVLCTVS